VLVSDSETGRFIMKKFSVALLLIAGLAGAGCSPSPEEQVRDPANCEQMKDSPELYQKCLEDLQKR